MQTLRHAQDNFNKRASLICTLAMPQAVHTGCAHVPLQAGHMAQEASSLKNVSVGLCK